MIISPTEAELDESYERPMTREELDAARRVPRVRSLRNALGLSQEQFSDAYRIPLSTLRDWEQGRSEPDAPARALLEIIAHEPEVAAKALEKRVAA